MPGLLAQQATSSSPNPSAAQAPNDQQQQQNSNQQKKEKKKKDKKKKKDDKGGSQDILNTEVFSDRVVSDVLGTIRDGLEGHSSRLMLSAFDDDKMDGYLSFEDQLEAMFNRYSEFSVHFRILNTSMEGQRGVALVDMQMEELPRDLNAQPVRRENQIRIELERGRKGWRIVDLRPRGFFS